MSGYRLKNLTNFKVINLKKKDMKLTAVEWLEQQLFNKRGKFTKGDIEQAKEMEREQIMTAFTQGDIFGADYFDGVNITAENYYKQTYESNT
jgi:hypothetical protein